MNGVRANQVFNGSSLQLLSNNNIKLIQEKQNEMLSVMGKSKLTSSEVKYT